MTEFVVLSLEFNLDLVFAVGLFDSEALEAGLGSHAFVEVGLHVSERHVVMGTFGSGEARLNGGKIELHHAG